MTKSYILMPLYGNSVQLTCLTLYELHRYHRERLWSYLYVVLHKVQNIKCHQKLYTGTCLHFMNREEAK
jgi:hypothetical protein